MNVIDYVKIITNNWTLAIYTILYTYKIIDEIDLERLMWGLWCKDLERLITINIEHLQYILHIYKIIDEIDLEGLKTKDCCSWF